LLSLSALVRLVVKRIPAYTIDPRGSKGKGRRLSSRSLEHPLLRLKFGPQLPFSLKPVSYIVTMLTAARDVDLKRPVGNLDVGWLELGQSCLRHSTPPASKLVPQFLIAVVSHVNFLRGNQHGLPIAMGIPAAIDQQTHESAATILGRPGGNMKGGAGASGARASRK
jgi:hypothetical protein